jgi:hypothetical protein
MRRYATMTDRRRDSHARPRVSGTGTRVTTGRTGRMRVQTSSPSGRTTSTGRAVRGIGGRRRQAPLVARLGLSLAVVALGVLVYTTATGGVGTLVAAFGQGVSSALGQITASPTPAPSIVVATDSPVIVAPVKAYTNAAAVDLQVVIPADVAGSVTATLRVYVALPGQDPAPITEVPVGASTAMTVPVQLTDGQNDFSASIVKQGVESPRSLSVTYILDTDPPKITLTSPKDKASVTTDTIVLTGTTQAGSAIVARNEANGTSVTGTASTKDGSFSLILPLVAGPNGIRITATDPAGNAADLIISITQGSGTLTATLTASQYRIKVSSPPSAIQFTVLVTDPKGAPVDGATAFFTVQLPGLAPVSSSLVTGGDGRATFTVPINGTLTVGSGQATVLVKHPAYGQTTARTALTFVQ